jgi:hypothetical protein
VHRTPVEQAIAALFPAEADVLGDAAQRHQVDLLVDGTDAARLRALRRAHFEWPALEQDFAGVAAVVAGQDLDQGGFTGAILADQGMDFAGLHLERGLDQRRNAGEALVDAPHREQQPVGHDRNSPRRETSRGRPPLPAGGLDSQINMRSAAVPPHSPACRSGPG